MRIIYAIFFGVLFLSANQISAQEKKESTKTDDFRKIAGKGIKINLTESGSSFIKLTAGIQFWYRNAELNPGTIDVQSGQEISNFQELATRRARIKSLTNIEDRFYFFMHFGSTNDAYTNTLYKGMFFHDIWGKLRIAKNTYIGGGLHMWSGLSRYTMQGGLMQITLDFPVTNFPNVNVTNQLNRNYGVFLQGRLSNFDYVFSVNQLMMPGVSKFLYSDKDAIDEINSGEPATGKTKAVLKPGVAFNRRLNGFNYKGYVSYSFFNKESLVVPFKSMTYLGKKGKILNIGAGFNYAPNAAGVVETVGATEVKTYDQLVWSTDVFFETPLANKSAFNLYAAYYNANYGPKYLKKVAVMGQLVKGGTTLNGPGITGFNFGTGDMAYASVGYLLPKSLIPGKNGIQPFYSTTYKNFDGLKQSSLQHDFGVNYLIVGNRVKLTAQYSTRPVYSKDEKTVSENKGTFLMQMQFRI
ncbi:MAG: hypothetical protein ABFR62_05325 [Bacteroidota bacterium]